jgi:hypothetical protein
MVWQFSMEPNLNHRWPPEGESPSIDSSSWSKTPSPWTQKNIKQPETFVCVSCSEDSLCKWLEHVRTGETTTYLWLGVQVGNHKWITFKCHRGSDLWMEQIHTETGVHFGVPRRAALLQDPSSCGESHAGCQDLAGACDWTHVSKN